MKVEPEIRNETMDEIPLSGGGTTIKRSMSLTSVKSTDTSESNVEDLLEVQRKKKKTVRRRRLSLMEASESMVISNSTRTSRIKPSEKESIVMGAESASDSTALLDKEKPWWLLLPTNPLILWWDRVMLLLLIEVLVYQPWNCVFQTGTTYFIIDNVITLIFIMDCAMQFGIAIMNEDGTYVSDGRKLAYAYICSDFPILFVACIPYDLLAYIFTGSRLKGTGAIIALSLSCIRCYRIKRSTYHAKVRTVDRFSAWLHRHPMMIAGMRVLTLLFVFLLMAHWFCCVYIAVGERSKDRESWIRAAGLIDRTPEEQYLTAFYFSVTMLTTIGYGDIVPISDGERIIWVVMAIFGAILYAAIFGTVTTTVQKYDSMRSSLDKELQMIGTFCQTQGVPFKIESKLIKYRKHYFNATKGLDIDMVVRGLPHMLATEVKMSMYKEDVMKVPFFRGCSDPFVRSLVQEIVTGMCVVGDFIIHQGDPATALYCLRKGTAAVILFTDDGNAKRLSTITSGSIFGEIGLIIANGTRTASILAQSLCKFWSLSKNAFDDVLEDFPEYRSRIIAHTISYLEKRKREAERTEARAQKIESQKMACGTQSSDEKDIEEKRLRRLRTKTWQNTLKQLSVLADEQSKVESKDSKERSNKVGGTRSSMSRMQQRTSSVRSIIASNFDDEMHQRRVGAGSTRRTRVSGFGDNSESFSRRTRGGHRGSAISFSDRQIERSIAGIMFESENTRGDIAILQEQMKENSAMLRRLLGETDDNDNDGGEVPRGVVNRKRMSHDRRAGSFVSSLSEISDISATSGTSTPRDKNDL